MSDNPEKIYIERSGSNTALIAALVLIAMIAAGLFIYVNNRHERDDAITAAAQQVGDAAQDVGDAAKDAAKTTTGE